jgi:hypothetical protein
MSIVPRKPIRRPTVARAKKPIGHAVFKDIVKMSYEMGKADEQEQASQVFSKLMRYAFGVAIDTDWNTNPSCVLSDILLCGERGDLWDNDKCDLLFRYFVWKRGIKEFRKVLKELHYHPSADQHLVYAYRGQRYCKIEMCFQMLERYVEDKMPMLWKNNFP